ncbi:MAG: prolyl oligopeptidase family serine peptidase [Planctomycetaceae bacterium]
MISVKCPDCSKVYEVADELAGKAAKCRDCGGRIPIPQLRTNNDKDSDKVGDSDRSSAANRSKPVEPKSDSAKPPSPKPAAANSVPAKSKPVEKPKPKPATKPVPKQRLDDNVFDAELIEDDPGDIDDYGDMEDFDELEEVEDDLEDVWESRRRTPARRKKKANKAAKIISREGAFLATGAGKLAWRIWVITMRVTGVFGMLFMVLAIIGAFLSFNILLFGIVFLMFGMLVMGTKGVWGQGIPLSSESRIEGFAGEAVGSVLVLISNPAGWLVLLLLIGTIRFDNGNFAFGPGPDPAVVQPEGANAPVLPGAAPPVVADGSPINSFQIANIPVPTFQNLSGFQPISPHIQFASSSAIPSGQIPGTRMRFIYYEPTRPHAPQSLPCVIVASAGTNLLVGNEVPSPQYLKETQPYVEAGFAVLGISLDGEVADLQKASDAEFSRAYQQFRDAAAGVVNVRNGIEFLTRQVPQVDPNRIFIAGHSSAGTLALLAASYEPRLKGCVAYCPRSDVVAQFRDVLAQPGVDRTLPNLRNFAQQSSPLVQVSRVSCPIFLFHAADDSNVPVIESRAFNQLLKNNNKRVDYFEVPNGDHYDSMIQQGIPRAIPWIRGLASTSGSATETTTASADPNRTPPTGVTPVPALPGFPFGNLPQASNAPGRPSGRVVTFRFQSFAGNGDSMAAARQALSGIAWADPNDLEIDPAKGEIRIGQLGGSVNTETARQALLTAGFQMLPGITVGPKSANVPTGAPPNINFPPSTKSTPNAEPEKPPPPATVAEPAKNPSPNSATAKKDSPKTPPTTSAPAKEREPRAPRRIVLFRYERFTGKGSFEKAAREALKRFDWANPDDIVLDAKNHEIRVGLLAESPDFEPARKALSSAGFALTPGVTTATVKD